ncbi:transposase DNA-binding-containing protein [Burkholderia territorii]|uniref:IS4/Tn5 family transposase DNA-binding protein n=1 Tax=Burkholderia territorii TaxID=1503055 RepID=UPI0009BE8FAD|nr:transposase DNA-binding-containing protein [Burkholderia territorii]
MALGQLNPQRYREVYGAFLEKAEPQAGGVVNRERAVTLTMLAIAGRASSWANEESAGIDLGDMKRNERTTMLLTRFAGKPTARIVSASHGWSKTIAAYRLLENDEVGRHDIMQPHWQHAREHETPSEDSRAAPISRSSSSSASEAQ